MLVPRIHLIETRFDINQSANDPNIYESCCWKYLDEEICKRLVNGKVYFHRTKAGKSYMSGTIIGFRPAGKRREDSVIILFRKDEDGNDANGVLVDDTDGWQPTGKEHIGIYPYRQIIF